MSELGTVTKDTDAFIWQLDDFISLQRARSPSFEIDGVLLHLQMSVYAKDDRLELSVHTENTPRERFYVTFEVNTGYNETVERRRGRMDNEGNFYVRRWMPWSEILSRRLDIFGDYGGLRVTCRLENGETIFTDTRMSSTSQQCPTYRPGTCPGPRRYSIRHLVIGKGTMPQPAISDISGDLTCTSSKNHLGKLLKTDKEKEKNKLKKRRRKENVICIEDSDEEDNATPPESIKDLRKDMTSLLISGENSDVTMRVQGKEFPAHRCILGMRSPVFQSMFRHDMEEKKTGVVDIDDCDPEIFPDFLTHLYTGKTSHVTSKNVFGLYSVSDKYSLGYLKEACLAFMKVNLTCENFCPTMSLALQHNEQELVSSAEEFFCGFAPKIIETKEWQVFLANNSTAGNELFRAALKTKKPNLV